MPKLSQKAKLEQFDGIKAERDSLMLALYDLVNKKFSSPVRIALKNLDQREEGHFTMRLSYRAMPLYLVEYRCKGAVVANTEVYTDNQILDFHRENPHLFWNKALHYGRSLLLAAHYATEAKSA